MLEAKGKAERQQVSYEPPRLEVIGTLQDLTLSGEGDTFDGTGFLSLPV